MSETTNFPLTPTQGSCLLGVASFLGAFVSQYILENFSHKKVIGYGMTIMFISMTSIGIF